MRKSEKPVGGEEEGVFGGAGLLRAQEGWGIGGEVSLDGRAVEFAAEEDAGADAMPGDGCGSGGYGAAGEGAGRG